MIQRDLNGAGRRQEYGWDNVVTGTKRSEALGSSEADAKAERRDKVLMEESHALRSNRLI